MSLSFSHSTSGLVVILYTDILKNANCILALQEAVKLGKRIVLVHDIKSRFPQPLEIVKLPQEIQPIFSSIAVPLLQEYISKAWTKIADKLFGRIKVKTVYYNLKIASWTYELVSQS